MTNSRLGFTDMGFGLFLIILSALSASWVTWVFMTRSHDRKIAQYAAVITDFDQQNVNLGRQFREMQQTLVNNQNNTQFEELQKKTNELVERRKNTIAIVKKIRAKIEEKYENYPLGKYVLEELEYIHPSPKMIENQHIQEAQLAFRRIQTRMKG